MSNPHPDMSGLKPWQPGQSGNPSGLPKDHISRRLRARKDADFDKLCNKLWAMAMKGNLRAAIEIIDRVEGKVPLPTNLEGAIEIVVRRADRNG